VTCTGCTVPAVLRKDARIEPAAGDKPSKTGNIWGPNVTVAPGQWPGTTRRCRGSAPALQDVSRWRAVLVAGLTTARQGTPDAGFRPPGKCLLTVACVNRLFVGKKPEAHSLQVSQQTDLARHGGHCRSNFPRVDTKSSNAMIGGR